jgi:hypothetical protein
LQFPAFAVGQDQRHPIQTHHLSNARGNGLKNIAQLEIGNYAVVQIQDQSQLGSFLV